MQCGAGGSQPDALGAGAEGGACSEGRRFAPAGRQSAAGIAATSWAAAGGLEKSAEPELVPLATSGEGNGDSLRDRNTLADHPLRAEALGGGREFFSSGSGLRR